MISTRAPIRKTGENAGASGPLWAGARLAIGCVRGYQWLCRPWLGPLCRFHPSCSDYCILAIRKHGLCRGSVRTLGRILRCHPFHPGGVDYP